MKERMSVIIEVPKTRDEELNAGLRAGDFISRYIRNRDLQAVEELLTARNMLDPMEDYDVFFVGVPDNEKTDDHFRSLLIEKPIFDRFGRMIYKYTTTLSYVLFPVRKN